VLLHPRAELTVHQRVAPVDTAIAKFGEGPIAGPTTISIDGVSIPGVATDGVDPIDDAFAPAQFFELTDDQKLTRPSFERLPAGRRLKTSSFSTGTSQGADQHYVTITVDDPRLRPGDDRNGKLVDAYRVDSGLRVAMAELTGGGLETPTRYVSPSQGTAVAEPRYAVAGRRDLEPTGTYATYTDAAAAQRDDAATAIVGMHEAR
jgi:hypothetical protein